MQYNKQESFTILPFSLFRETAVIRKEFHQLKKKVFAYRLIFLLFGTFFTAMTMLLFLKTANWSFAILFGHGAAVKSFTSLVTGTLALSSLWLGSSMRTDREIVRVLTKHNLRHLNRAFIQKSIPTHISKLFLDLNEAKREKELKCFYEECVEEMEKLTSILHHQLDQINSIKTGLESERTEKKLTLLAQFKVDLREIVKKLSVFPH